MIVEPNFREAFELPMGGAKYQALVQRIPQLFVGTKVTLFMLVKEIAGHMAAEYVRLVSTVIVAKTDFGKC